MITTGIGRSRYSGRLLQNSAHKSTGTTASSLTAADSFLSRLPSAYEAAHMKNMGRNTSCRAPNALATKPAPMK